MESSQGTSRLVVLTEAATYDLIALDHATAQQWGEAQADRYSTYIRDVLTQLAAKPHWGQPLIDWPNYLVFVAKFSKRRNSYGHRIFYTVVEDGILVIRILHTAMNWPDHFVVDG